MYIGLVFSHWHYGFLSTLFTHDPYFGGAFYLVAWIIMSSFPFFYDSIHPISYVLLRLNVILPTVFVAGVCVASLLIRVLACPRLLDVSVFFRGYYGNNCEMISNYIGYILVYPWTSLLFLGSVIILNGVLFTADTYGNFISSTTRWTVGISSLTLGLFLFILGGYYAWKTVGIGFIGNSNAKFACLLILMISVCSFPYDLLRESIPKWHGLITLIIITSTYMLVWIVIRYWDKNKIYCAYVKPCFLSAWGVVVTIFVVGWIIDCIMYSTPGKDDDILEVYYGILTTSVIFLAGLLFYWKVSTKQSGLDHTMDPDECAPLDRPVENPSCTLSSPSIDPCGGEDRGYPHGYDYRNKF